jgi:two-component system, cell cycle sensor histidine kinase and response regulator CckA
MVQDPYNRPHPPLSSYGYAVVAAIVAVGARLLASYFGYQHQYALLYIAVLWSSWYGGMWPALLTSALGAVSVAFLGTSTGHLMTGFQRGNLVGVEFYAMVTLTAAVLFEAERGARQRAHRSAQDAQRRLEEFQRETGLRKAAEQAASRAEEQFGLTVEHAPVGICRISLDGRFEEVNPQFCAITGYTREELQGLSFREITHPDDLAATVEGYEAIRDGKRAYFNLEKRYLRKDGAVVWASLTGAAVGAGAGRPQFLLGVSQDITSRREAEEQLRETQRLESVGRLAGGIAHDFNNLMTAVLGNASLALDMLPAESAERALIEGVAAAAERAASLTRQLLAYAGKGQFQRADVDLSGVASRATELIRLAVPAKIDFRLTLSGQLPPLVADPSQLQQLVTNLAMNAIEAIGDRRGTVAIRTERVRFSRENGVPVVAVGRIRFGEYLRLAVEDTGSGMDSGTVRRIFDPFFTTRFMGRGLGLAAVAGIVRTLQGAVVVRSAPGQGTTMEILIPAPTAASRQALAAAPAD